MKTQNIMIRVSPKDYEQVKMQAQREQMSVSEYVRYLIRKDVER